MTLPRDQLNVSATGVLSVEEVATFDTTEIVNGILTVTTRVAPDVDRTFVTADGRLTVVEGVGEMASVDAFLLNEADGVSLDLMSGQARVKDTITPANTFSGKLRDLAVYSSNTSSQVAPSPKLLRSADGIWRYRAHNLFQTSDAPATQAVGALIDATYEISVEGAGSIALSGGATGTVSAGAPVAFKATTNSVTCTVSGSLTRAHMRRTPSDSEYIATGAAVKFDLPYEWDEDGNPLGLQPETQIASNALWASDFTNAVWSKTNVTASMTATGPTGVANSASILTATADAATVLQSITSGSAARRTSCFVKRRTGSGVVEMTQDNGTTWVPVTVTAGWTRVNIPSATVTNPIVGFRMATSGDEIDVAIFNCTAGADLSSPIEVFGSVANATRAGDYIYVPATKFAVGATGMTLYASGECSETSNRVMVEIRAPSRADTLEQFLNNPAQQLFRGFTTSFATQHSNILEAPTVMPTGQVVRRAASAAADDFRAVQDGVFATADTAGLFQTTGFERIAIGGSGGAGGADNPNAHIREIVYLPRASTDDELAAMHTPKMRAEKAASLHLVGDSFLNGQGLLQFLRTSNPRLGNVLRMTSKDGVGGTTLAQQAVRFAATPWYWDHTLIIVDGGLTDAEADAIAAIADMAGRLSHNRWLYLQAGFPDRTVSQATVLARLAVDASIAAAFPGHYVGTYDYVRANGTGSAVGSGSGEVWPLDSCTSASDGHPNSQGQGLLVDTINTALAAQGW